MTAFQNDAFQNDAFQSDGGGTTHEGAAASTAAATSSASGTVLFGGSASASAVATSDANLTPAITIHEGAAAATATATTSSVATLIHGSAASASATASSSVAGSYLPGGRARSTAVATSSATATAKWIAGQTHALARATSWATPSLVIPDMGTSVAGTPNSRIQIVYDSIDITALCLLAEARFTARANGRAGEAEIGIKDTEQALDLIPGKTLELFINGVREWDGWGVDLRRAYWFEGTTSTLMPRKWKLIGADRNLLFQRRVLYNKADPDAAVDNSYEADTSDRSVITNSLANFLDNLDGINTTLKVEEVGSPDPFQPFKLPGPGAYFGEFMSRVANDVGGTVFHIDPDRFLVYTDVNEPNAPFGISDSPDAPQSSTISSADEFDRTVSGSWGSSPWGTWATQGSGLSVNGSAGVITGTGFDGGFTPTNATASTTKTTYTTRFTWPGLSGFRLIDIEITNSTWTDSCGAQVAGNELYIWVFRNSDAYSTSDALAITPTVGSTGYLKVERDLVAGTVQAKYWEEGDPEPNWMLTLTDSVVTTLGTLDYVFLGREVNTSSTFLFDRFASEIVTTTEPSGDLLGCREMTILSDANQMVNDALIWGAGLGADVPVFARVTDNNSVALHGRWQNSGGFRQSVWKQESVDRIADSIVYGSPSSQRGHKDDAVTVTCTLFYPGLRVGQKVRVVSGVHGYDDVVPLRDMTITFPTPVQARYDLRLSHELDQPWSITDPWRPRRDGPCETVNCEVVSGSTVPTCLWDQFNGDLDGRWRYSGDVYVSGGALHIASGDSIRSNPPTLIGSTEVHLRAVLRTAASTAGDQTLVMRLANGLIFARADLRVNGHNAWELAVAGSSGPTGSYTGTAWADDTDYIMEWRYERGVTTQVRLYPADETAPDWQIDLATTNNVGSPDLQVFVGLNSGSEFEFIVDSLAICGDGEGTAGGVWNTVPNQEHIGLQATSGTPTFPFEGGAPQPGTFLNDLFGSFPITRRQYQARIAYPIGTKWLRVNPGAGVYLTGLTQPIGHPPDPGPTFAVHYGVFIKDDPVTWPPALMFDPPGTLWHTGITNETGDFHGFPVDAPILAADPGGVMQFYMKTTPFGGTGGANSSQFHFQYLLPGSDPAVWDSGDEHHTLEERVCYPVNTCGEVCVVPVLDHCEGSVCYYRATIPFFGGTAMLYMGGELLEKGTDWDEHSPSQGLIVVNAEVTDDLYLCFEGTGYRNVGFTPLNIAMAADGKFVLPVSGPVTAAFGPQNSMVWASAVWHNTYYPSFHNGVDFGVVTGTPVFSAAGGVVGYETQAAGGTMIHIFHPNGMRTTYAHLSSRVVSAGSSVVQGQLIGYSGSTGNVTGAHLHWGLVYNGSAENPMEFV